jgi:hypothetical protein
MIAAISLARRDEQLGEESCQIIKVIRTQNWELKRELVIDNSLISQLID